MKSIFATSTTSIIIEIILIRATVLLNIIIALVKKLVYIINFQGMFARKVYDALPIRPIAICTIIGLALMTGIIVPVSGAGEIIDVNDPSLPSQISQYVAENDGYVVKDGYNYFFFDETSKLLLFREYKSRRGKVFVEYKQLTSEPNTLLPTRGIIRKIANNNEYIESIIYFPSPEELKEYGIIDESGKIIKFHYGRIFDDTDVEWVTYRYGYARLFDQRVDPMNPDDDKATYFLHLREKPVDKRRIESGSSDSINEAGSVGDNTNNEKSVPSDSSDSINEAGSVGDDTNNEKSVPGFEIFGAIYPFIIFILKRKIVKT